MALLLVGVTAVVVVTTHVRASADCSRTPLSLSDDARGAPLSEVRQSIAREYTTQARFVSSDRDGADAVEASIRDAAGSHVLGTVRIVRAPSGVGWLQATANTCDD